MAKQISKCWKILKNLLTIMAGILSMGSHVYWMGRLSSEDLNYKFYSEIGHLSSSSKPLATHIKWGTIYNIYIN